MVFPLLPEKVFEEATKEKKEVNVPEKIRKAFMPKREDEEAGNKWLPFLVALLGTYILSSLLHLHFLWFFLGIWFAKLFGKKEKPPSPTYLDRPPPPKVTLPQVIETTSPPRTARKKEEKEVEKGEMKVTEV